MFDVRVSLATAIPRLITILGGATATLASPRPSDTAPRPHRYTLPRHSCKRSMNPTKRAAINHTTTRLHSDQCKKWMRKHTSMNFFTYPHVKRFRSKHLHIYQFSDLNITHPQWSTSLEYTSAEFRIERSKR